MFFAMGLFSILCHLYAIFTGWHYTLVVKACHPSGDDMPSFLVGGDDMLSPEGWHAIT
jgi:hypothetical protein